VKNTSVRQPQAHWRVSSNPSSSDRTTRGDLVLPELLAVHGRTKPIRPATGLVSIAVNNTRAIHRRSRINRSKPPSSIRFWYVLHRELRPSRPAQAVARDIGLLKDSVGAPGLEPGIDD